MQLVAKNVKVVVEVIDKKVNIFDFVHINNRHHNYLYEC